MNNNAAALLALADAATLLSDEESGVNDTSQSYQAAASSSPEKTNAAVVADDRRPMKKRFVLPRVPVQSPMNGNVRANTPPFQTIRVPDPRDAPPMPLSMLPKKKRKKKEEKNRYTDLQGQYLATTWYFNESTFPVTLLAIMESQSQGNSPCITFLSDNQRFVIVDPARLEKEIFPKHFEIRTPTLEQFSEMLDLWGFEKTVDETFPNVNVYKHEQFKKGDWEKCLRIEMPIGSLEKLAKIQVVQSEKSISSHPDQRPRKGQRRGNGVPPPPPELLTLDASSGMTPRSNKLPKQIRSPSHRTVSEDKLGPVFSQLVQNHYPSMLLNQSFQHHQHQNPLDMILCRRISADTNPFTQTFQQCSPSLPSAGVAIASKTQDVVTAAIHAMNQGDGSAAPVPAPPAFHSRRITIDNGSRPKSQLDVMTEQFLVQSSARLKSRPSAIMGPATTTIAGLPFRSSSLPIGNNIGGPSLSDHLKIQAMFAAQQSLDNNRRVSMLGNTSM